MQNEIILQKRATGSWDYVVNCLSAGGTWFLALKKRLKGKRIKEGGERNCNCLNPTNQHCIF